MEKSRRFALLDGTALKIIAMASMILDHVGDNFFPGQLWMRALGRIAMPIFAFCVAEGFIHTRDRGRYLRRMGVFALVSEIPFDLVTAGKVLEFSHQNILVTFFWAILALICYEKILSGGRSAGRTALGAVVLAGAALASLPLGMDYNLLAVGMIFLFTLLRNKTLPFRNLAVMAYHALLRNVGIYWFGLLGFLPLFLYNGKRGRGLKWLFYVFYPGHLLAIYLLRTLLAA
ncbi:MAG: hypothetical protein IJH47_05670 [Oscillospiraceae bacterium]|nr:hypothetical protein [Oscillospiraceae bacterium]